MNKMVPFHLDLYEVFEKQLVGLDNRTEIKTEDFATTVAKTYIDQLKKRGFSVPLDFLEELESELAEDVLDMTRKKIYGSLSLKEFVSRRKT